MSLLLLEGFDDSEYDVRGVTFGSPVIQSSTRNKFGNVMFLDRDDNIRWNLGAGADDVVTIGAWWELEGAFPSSAQIDGHCAVEFWGDSFTTRHVQFSITPTGELRAMRGSTVLGTSSVIWSSVDSPHYVEIKVKLHDTTGTVDIHSDGVSVLSLSSQDTKNGGTLTTFDAIRWRTTDNGSYRGDQRIDDVYITNEVGSAPYDGMLGGIGVETVFPDGDGNYTGYTRTTGATDWGAVDENPHDSDTTYLESSTDTDRSNFTMDNLVTTTGDIYGVMATAIMRNTGASDNVQLSTRISLTDYDSANIAVPASYGLVEKIWETSPATASDWTISEFNGAEFGVENVA